MDIQDPEEDNFPNFSSAVVGADGNDEGQGHATANEGRGTGAADRTADEGHATAGALLPLAIKIRKILLFCQHLLNLAKL